MKIEMNMQSTMLQFMICHTISTRVWLLVCDDFFLGEVKSTLLALFLFFIFGTQDAFDHLTSFLSSREMISQPRIELPTTLFGLGTFPLSCSSLGSSRTTPRHFLVFSRISSASINNYDRKKLKCHCHLLLHFRAPIKFSIRKGGGGLC